MVETKDKNGWRAHMKQRREELATTAVMQRLIDVAQASAVPLAEVVEGYKSLTGLIADRDAEVALADCLANTGHHARNCPALIERVKIGKVTMGGVELEGISNLMIDGVDYTDALGLRVADECTCGWNAAIKAWRERRDG